MGESRQMFCESESGLVSHPGAACPQATAWRLVLCCPGVFQSILLGALRYSCWASFAFFQHGFWLLLTEAMKVVLGAGGCVTCPPWSHLPSTGRRAAVGKLVLCTTHQCQPFAYCLNPSHGRRWVKPWGHRDAQSKFHTGTVQAFNIRTQLHFPSFFHFDKKRNQTNKKTCWLTAPQPPTKTHLLFTCLG